jgi:hypothetical protein
MRFYGWSWPETMKTPVSAFWTCYGYVDRLRADESLDSLDQAVFAWMDESGKKSVLSSLKKRRGMVSVEKATFNKEGWSALKNLSKK